jgi:hypothetical protein
MPLESQHHSGIRYFAGGYRVIKSVYRFAVTNSWSMLTAAMYVQMSVSQALAPAVPLARYNQCPLMKKAWFVTTCAREDELYQHYQIVKNVPSLTDVKHFIFTGQHGEPRQIELKIHFLNTLPTPNDTILFEGINFGTQIFCSSYQDVGDNYHASIEINNPDPRYSAGLNSYGKVVHYHLSDDLVCKGWDDKALADAQGPRFVAVIEMQNAFSELIDKTIDFSDGIVLTGETYKQSEHTIKKILELYCDELDVLIKRYNLLEPKVSPQEAKRKTFIKNIKNAADYNAKEMLNKFNLIVVEFENYLRSRYDFYAEHYKTLGDQTIVMRNKAAIKTFDFYKTFAGRTYSLFGEAHLRNYRRTPPYKSIDVIDKDDPAFPLREALDQQPHAILFLKP